MCVVYAAAVRSICYNFATKQYIISYSPQEIIIMLKVDKRDYRQKLL